VDEQRPAYIIGNKVDLLPRDGPGYLDRVKRSVLKLCDERGIVAQHVALISAKTGYGVETLISRLLRDWKLKGSRVYSLVTSKLRLFLSMLHTVSFPPFPQIDIIGVVVIVWRVRGKIIRYVLFNIVCSNCAQCDAHTL